jgi:citrate synthase
MNREVVMKEWHSEITDVQLGQMTTYGVDQVDIVRSFSFEDMIFLLLQGKQPTDTERDLLRAVIVSHISHGITGQSTLAVRMAADCRSSFLHALIAGFSTGAGVYHRGGLQATMQELRALVEIPPPALAEHLAALVADGRRVMGYGHRFHKDVEPRATALMELADAHGFSGKHIERAREVGTILHGLKGIPMNIEAAGGSILLDLGFRTEIAHLFIILGRSTMFAAAYQERLDEGTRPFPRLKVFDVDR